MRAESVAKSIKMLKGILDGKTYVAVAQECGLSRSGVEQRVKALAAKAPEVARGPGIELDALEPSVSPGRIEYRHVTLQLDQGERIRVQVVDERGVGRDLLGLHSELFGDDALELLVTVRVHPTPLLAVRVRSNSSRSPGPSS